MCDTMAAHGQTYFSPPQQSEAKKRRLLQAEKRRLAYEQKMARLGERLMRRWRNKQTRLT